MVAITMTIETNNNLLDFTTRVVLGGSIYIILILTLEPKIRSIFLQIIKNKPLINP
jgi:hypothetical protein